MSDPTEHNAVRVQTTVRQQNARGEWVPSIPEPFVVGAFGRCQCQCGRVLRGRQRYREHYAYAHVLGMEDE